MNIVTGTTIVVNLKTNTVEQIASMVVTETVRWERDLKARNVRHGEVTYETEQHKHEPWSFRITLTTMEFVANELREIELFDFVEDLHGLFEDKTVPVYMAYIPEQGLTDAYLSFLPHWGEEQAVFLAEDRPSVIVFEADLAEVTE